MKDDFGDKLLVGIIIFFCYGEIFILFESSVNSFPFIAFFYAKYGRQMISRSYFAQGTYSICNSVSSARMHKIGLITDL